MRQCGEWAIGWGGLRESDEQMNHYENKLVKKYLMFSLALIAAASVGMAFLTLRQCKRQREAENAAVYALLREVVENDPDADVSVLIEVMNDEKSYSKADAEELRSRYGLYADVAALPSVEKLRAQLTLQSVVTLILASGAVLLVFLLYLRRRRQKIEQLADYMEQISMGRYDMDLRDNSEDELSNLKNQLYKLTVMLREQAKTATTQKEALAESVSDISHQLKTPLTSAMILLDNLGDNPDMDEKLRIRFIGEAARQVDSMKWMIVSMLKLSRLDAGMVEMENEKFSVKQMVADGVDYLSVLLDLKEISVEEKIREGSERAFLYGDRRWNQEAFVNLLKNAAEHSETGGVIRVGIESNDVYTAVSVANEGEPFTRKQEQEMFRRYYSAAGNADSENAGIGLPLAKAILERQNGYLTVASEDGWNIFTMKYLSY